MDDHFTLGRRSIVIDGALGTLFGAALVLVLLASDSFALGTMVRQSEQAWLHVFVMLFKPMLLFGVLAAGWSLLRGAGRQRNWAATGGVPLRQLIRSTPIFDARS